MKLSQFKFDLPTELIASHPSKNRDESKLMVLNRKDGTIEHRSFKDILDYFDEGDVFVINNTRVFPARLYGEKEKTGAKIEVFLLRELNQESRLWDVLVDPARKIRIGNKLYFGDDESLVAEVIDNTTSRGRTLRFLFDGSYDEFKQTLQSLGETPLPKIHQRPVEEIDDERYQTIYAKHEGAIAAPTAGLHFSREIMKRLEIQGINFAEVTLHTGLGNFRAIEVEDLSKHKVDSEEMFINQGNANIINGAKTKKKKICAVGTTSMKALETAVSITGLVKPYSGWTNKFINPPYSFRTADAMITNFHLPMSPMMMMASAYMGHDFLKEVYATAIKKKYKFFTYGDAMLII
ncbi:MAG: tRNA preQ1(34) S-adenosylmethionine ribosyltransferase-isomerase QueA [Bacteroidales bacterium]|jgi:S-adenosylmethionine:tRNA ribosyltransferase-isomerase|nr:tRNA preQ1(34) S-adenosylmethionine ribosyltransferase-isomerase QueA [Lentimicrobiaceae bacterium]MDG1136452.1 tRNA preQ1(34) S-adenosylmethionine ribosyltransferase-isomerase QueA [Bacteroidales bacterium]MDG1902496.1 tRNA preQ1(34) S-adenosylmethionine ribosyltransferase-isomerase QueA [Bacteroidales bacterium]MDG2081966.1 tRNA preQ1(34) S-adenosylmethionine ribosyltransferase-isomerase QueA [Bacteroidales bacterium]|tara:strand:- start:5575 stop:6624 length:1050 start_codon:yes stop_codon:yes gene_type:complete